MKDRSPAQAIAAAIVTEHGENAPAALDALLERFTLLELAAMAYDWRGLWARAKQLPPETGWRSFGFLTGRGFGKTRAIAELVTHEVMAGRAREIALAAQTEEKTEDVMIDGPSGLLAVAPPWFKPTWVNSQVIWPNGARAACFTPEKPGNMRGPEHDLVWLSEVQSWPKTTMLEAFKNIRFGLRKGLGRMVWDATPKRRHQLLRWLVARAARDPNLHVIVRGAMWENLANLTPEVVQELVEDYGGTQAGEEELEGILRDDADGALWKQEWINEHRKHLPTELKRRIISCDPAISMREGTDPVGVIEQALGHDGHVYVEGDLSERMPPSVWGPLLIDRYVERECDCIVAERDRGGNLVAEIVRLNAREREMQLVVLGEKDTPQHIPGVIYIREVNTQQKSKSERAQPVADRYQSGKVHHVLGAVVRREGRLERADKLDELEDELTTWDPNESGPSPNRLDADVQGVRELLGITDKRRDRRAGFKGIQQANQMLSAVQEPTPGGIQSLLLHSRRGGGESL